MKQITFFLLLICSLSVFGQNGFISTDSVTTTGLRIVNSGSSINAVQCQVKSGSGIKTYTPDQITEYGFTKDIVYKTFKIGTGSEAKNYFLLRVSKKPQIYYLKTGLSNPRYFVLEKDGKTLSEIPKSRGEYLQVIRSISPECEIATENIKYIKLRKDMLSRYFTEAQNCTGNPLPRTRFSVYGGYSLGTVSQDMVAVLPGVPNKLKNSFVTFGASADFPVLPGNMSFHTSIFYKQTGVSAIPYDADTRFEFEVNYSTLVVPVLFRYTRYRKLLSPYLEAGLVVGQTLKNDGKIRLYDLVSPNTVKSVMNTTVISNTMPGIGAGAGTILFYGSRVSYFAGINYYKLLRMKNSLKYFNFSDISISAGFLF